MLLSRRSFVTALGLTGAGVAAAPLVGARGHEALAAALRRGDPAPPELVLAGRVVRLSSNENPRGPCAVAMEAIRGAIGDGSRYPVAPHDELRKAVAESLGVGEDHILLGCGSGEILRLAVDAFTGPTRPLVTAAPTFEAPADRAAVLGTPVRAVRVRDDLRLDLAAMAAQAPGAGLVFVCNPNNPTGAVHPAAAIADHVRRVVAASPRTTVLVDEAYHEYVEDPAYATAIPLALASP
jgi:histidinol-phosphate aminotransferase